MRRPFSYSFALHLLVVLLLFVVMPNWRDTPVVPEEPLTVELENFGLPAGKTPAASAAKGEQAADAAKEDGSPLPAPAVKSEAPEAAVPKAEAPKAEAPKAEAPKAETPKPAVKPQAPKPEPVKAEPKAKPVPSPEPAKVAERTPPEPSASRKAEARPAEKKPAEAKPAEDKRAEPVKAAAPKPKAQPPKPEPAESRTAKPEPTKPATAKPEPQKPEPPKPAPAKPEPEKKTEKAEKPDKPEPAEAKKPEAAAKQPSAAEKPAPATKPAPKATKPADEEGDDFASVAKTVKEMKRSPSAGDSRAAAKPKQAATADGRDGESLADQVNRALRSGVGAVASSAGASQAASARPLAGPVTASEIDGVRRQIEQCWNLPAGLKGTADMVVSIRVEMGIDGRPRSAVIENAARMDSDPSYRATAESAKRAVLNPRCQPFKLPPEKYERWRTLTLVFNPAEMFRT